MGRAADELEKLRNRLAHVERARDELTGQLAAAQANARTFMRERDAARRHVHALRVGLRDACEVIDGGGAYCSDCDRGSRADSFRDIIAAASVIPEQRP